MKRYALIVGHGRSGTNWLLDILNSSPCTFCRNEPNEIQGSPCQKLQPLWQVHSKMPDMDENWDDIASWMSHKMGERDLRFPGSKDYVHEFSRSIGIANFTTRPKIRAGLQLILPALRSGEWSMPWWVGKPNELENSYAVLKINQAARIAVWLLQNRPTVPILHIVRHPGGRLNSWLRRFLAAHDQALIDDRNKERLKAVLQVSPEWANFFGEIDHMSIAESETWFWRYVTESIHRVGKNLPQYKLLLYEKLAQDPIGISQQIFEFCGLDWSDNISDLISQRTQHSPWGKIKGSPQLVAQAWTQKLTTDEINSINRVLGDSLMETWW